MADFVVALEGIDDLDDIRDLKANIELAAFRSINDAAARGRTMSAKMITDQIAFPENYVNGKNSRLQVTKKAKGGDLEAIITGRQRPTSLARFAVGGVPKRQGVDVQVKRGKTTFLSRAFLMPLKSGSASIDTARNLGLALRVPRGQTPSKAWKPVKISEGLFLLYGPSVDQVFKSVRGDVGPELSTYLEKEFTRQLRL